MTGRHCDIDGALGEGERARLILDTAFQFMGLLDAEGTMLDVNRSALAWVRSHREAAVGRKVWDTPWWVNAGEAVLARLKAAVATAARGEFVRYDVTLPAIEGPPRTFDFSLTPVADAAGGKIEYLVAEGRDVTEQKRLESALHEANRRLQLAQEQERRLAITDDLTGLYNRRGFFIIAEQQKRLAIRSGARCLLLFVDVDDLKGVNDQWGHEVGDGFIAGAAKVLAGSFRSSDLVARLGGDEFAALAVLGEGDSTTAFAERLAGNLAAFNREAALSLPLRMSVGTYEFEWTEPLGIDTLVARADAAMYGQKRGKPRSTS